MSELKTSEVLDLAADVMEGRGWTTGEWNNSKDDAPVCIEGAILAAMQLPDVAELGDEEYMKLQSCPSFVAVKRYVDYEDGDLLYGWNDQYRHDPELDEWVPAHTKESVIEVLRGAAEAERQKENQK